MTRFMFAIILTLSLGVSAQGANCYVEANASKGGDGTATAPFATIQQAADVAQAGDTVFIRPGTYSETVKPKNSDKEGSPITFRNCPGEEKPTICAGDRVTGPWKAEGGGIYSAACPWNVGSARNHEPAALTNGLAYAGNVVVVDGDLMIEAREPNISGKEQLATACRLGRLFSGEFRNDGDVVVRGVPWWDSNSVRWTVLTFTNNGSFTVAGGPAEYLIVAGGGGGGGGGGGAGGVVSGSANTVKGEHRVAVGAGGGVRSNGEPSSIVGPVICWTATGGGRGGDWKVNGSDGGSGGGAGNMTLNIEHRTSNIERGISDFSVGCSMVTTQEGAD